MSEQTYNEALKELLFKMADDQIIIGHRVSEWIGIGPAIEEDIAFGSLAQDKTGHAYNLYQLLNKLGEAEPDFLAFHRKEKDFRCCHLVELPIEEYDFSLARHFFFDHAEFLRFDMLAISNYEPLANMARKFKTEIKYHVFHANTWLKQLGQASEESISRMQSAINEAYPLALGIFEPGPFEDILKAEGIFEGEAALKIKWQESVSTFIENIGLQLPTVKDEKQSFGGRAGHHTEFLAPLLHEMTEVFTIDPSAGW
jgi:ring-1,2-phenylacetyl-CoA epoxidase subunit PaaC